MHCPTTRLPESCLCVCLSTFCRVEGFRERRDDTEPCDFERAEIPDLPDLLSKPIRDDRISVKETCSYQEYLKA
jgi:hypothetical protein